MGRLQKAQPEMNDKDDNESGNEDAEENHDDEEDENEEEDRQVDQASKTKNRNVKHKTKGKIFLFLFVTSLMMPLKNLWLRTSVNLAALNTHYLLSISLRGWLKVRPL